MTTLLIDGDGFAYQAALSAEKATDWGDGMWSLTADANEAQAHLDNAIEAVKEALGSSNIAVAITDSDLNFRKRVWPGYKAKRSKQRKPLVLPVMRQHLLDQYAARLRPNLEADDVIGILMTHPKLVPGDKIIVSADKDFFTIPGKFYRTTDDKPKVVRVSEHEADRWHLIQTLAGDATDEYPGCPGIGMERAAEAIDAMTKLIPYEHVVTRGARKGQTETRYSEEPAGSPWEVVVSRYVAAGLTETDALVQARCARILRATDYDFQKKEPILWTPTK